MERINQEIDRFLRTYCHKHQHIWISFLPWAKYTQNSPRQPTTGLTPIPVHTLLFIYPCFHGPVSGLRFQLWTVVSGIARVSGTQLTSTFKGQFGITKARPISGEQIHTLALVALLQVTLVHSLSSNILMQSHTSYISIHITALHLPSARVSRKGPKCRMCESKIY